MTASTLRIVFAGTPAFAAAHLDYLLENNLDIAAVITQPDRPAGRGKQVQASPVKRVALDHDLPVYQPETLNSPESWSELAALAPDVLVVVAFGQILKQDVLDIPRFGCLNVHASLLPRWRGAAPVERAILAGDSDTGISIMQMNAGLDTGDTLLKLTTAIAAEDNADTVTRRLLALGGDGLIQVLQDLPAYQSSAEKQNESRATYAAKLEKQDARIDWHQPALHIQHQVQAFYPRSPAFCSWNGDRLRLIAAIAATENPGAEPGTITGVDKHGIRVACGANTLLVTRIQLPGKKPTDLKDLLNGRPDFFTVGASLGGGEAIQ